MQYLGNIDAKVDAKGRVFVPAQFRRLLPEDDGQSMVLRIMSNQGYAKLYPMKEWDRVNEELKGRLNLWNRKDQALYRQFTAAAEQIDIDASGRILLNKKNMEALGIEQEVVFVGVGDYMELWSRERLDAAMSDDADMEQSLEELMR